MFENSFKESSARAIPAELQTLSFWKTGDGSPSLAKDFPQSLKEEAFAWFGRGGRGGFAGRLEEVGSGVVLDGVCVLLRWSWGGLMNQMYRSLFWLGCV